MGSEKSPIGRAFDETAHRVEWQGKRRRDRDSGCRPLNIQILAAAAEKSVEKRMNADGFPAAARRSANAEKTTRRMAAELIDRMDG